MSRDPLLIKINIGIKELGIEPDDARDIYELVTKKRSLRAMTSAERRAVLDNLKSKGFVVKRNANAKGRSSGYSAKAYVRLIHALWASCAKLGVIQDGSKPALRAFVADQTEKRTARIDDPEFLTYDQASPIIETLKSMEKRGKAASK